jgi:hypothetical protein
MPARSTHPRSRRSRLLLLLLGLAAPAALLREGILIPDRWQPWAPLSLAPTAGAPGPFVQLKLARLSRQPAACLEALATSPFRFTPLPDRDTGSGCGFRNAVRISGTGAEIGAAVSLSCRSAVALALWEQQVLQPAALAWFGEPVSRIEHFGSYACRNVNHRASGRRSQHATADAIDIAGFRLADGRRIRVLADWAAADGAATEEAQFLREVHRGACRFFDAVLGPDYNAAHRDHFHFDRGGFRACR